MWYDVTLIIIKDKIFYISWTRFTVFVDYIQSSQKPSRLDIDFFEPVAIIQVWKGKSSSSNACFSFFTHMLHHT